MHSDSEKLARFRVRPAIKALCGGLAGAFPGILACCNYGAFQSIAQHGEPLLSIWGLPGAICGMILTGGNMHSQLGWDIAIVGSSLFWGAIGAILVRVLKLPRRALPKVGYCPSCAYDLTGNVTGICPECGLRLRYWRKGPL